MRTLLIGLCIVAVVEAVISPALSEAVTSPALSETVPYGEPSPSPNEPPNQQERAQRKQDAPRSQPPGFDVVTDGHTSTVGGVAFPPNGNSMISAGNDKVIRIWDLGTAQTARSIDEHWPQGKAGEIYAIALSPDGKLLAVGGYMDTACPSPACGRIRLYEVASGALKGVLSGHTNIVLSLAFSADGMRLASSGPDRTTRAGALSVPRRRRAGVKGGVPRGQQACLDRVR